MERSSNLTFERQWEDHSVGPDLWIGISVDMWCSNGWARGYFDAQESTVSSFGDALVRFAGSGEEALSFTFVEGMHPFCAISVERLDCLGHLRMAVDVGIAPRSDDGERCRMAFDVEPGSLEAFGRAFKRLAGASIGASCSLFPDRPRIGIPLSLDVDYYQ